MTKCRCAHGLSWFRTCPACVRQRADVREEAFHLACMAVRDAEMSAESWDGDERAPIERRQGDRRVTDYRRRGDRRFADQRRYSPPWFDNVTLPWPRRLPVYED